MKGDRELDPERSLHGQKKAPWLLMGSDQKTEEAVLYLHKKGYTLRTMSIIFGTTADALESWMTRRGLRPTLEEQE